MAFLTSEVKDFYTPCLYSDEVVRSILVNKIPTISHRISSSNDPSWQSKDPHVCYHPPPFLYIYQTKSIRFIPNPMLLDPFVWISDFKCIFYDNGSIYMRSKENSCVQVCTIHINGIKSMFTCKRIQP